MLTSLVSCNPGQAFRCHVLCDGVDRMLRARVAECCQPVQILWYGVEQHQVLEFAPLLQITRATYLRLMMLEVLSPAIQRVLYLDVDVIVNGDLRPLWNTDMGDHVCAAVVDPGVDADAFATQYELSKPGRYFNAGVLLFDLTKLRGKHFLEQAIAILEDPTVHLEFADQDALNIVLWNQWLPVDPCWNFQRKFLYDDFAAWKSLNPKTREPAIIHFTERYKPWQHTEWHPYAWLYLRNLLRTSFSTEVLRTGGIGFADGFKWWLRYRLKRPAVFRAPRS